MDTMTNNDAENPRAIVGGNAPPDHGALAAERMNEEYGDLKKTVDELLAEALPLIGSKEKNIAPVYVTDDATMGDFAKLVKRLRDVAVQLASHHKREKEPYLRAGQAVDRFFFGLHELCTRRNRTDKPGAADILQARIDDFMQRKLAQEQARRNEEARLAREEEDRLTRKRLADEEAARQALAASERARKTENVEAHQAKAADHAASAASSKAEENIARERAVETANAAAAKPADLVGTRVSDDVKVTMARENYAEVDDVAKLSMADLWPFVDDDAKVKALKAWAKVTQYKRQMEGARIGSRPKTVIR